MWGPQYLTATQASMAYYRDNFTYTIVINITGVVWYLSQVKQIIWCIILWHNQDMGRSSLLINLYLNWKAHDCHNFGGRNPSEEYVKGSWSEEQDKWRKLSDIFVTNPTSNIFVHCSHLVITLCWSATFWLDSHVKLFIYEDRAAETADWPRRACGGEKIDVTLTKVLHKMLHTWNQLVDHMGTIQVFHRELSSRLEALFLSPKSAPSTP